jgi:23S rRNA pseudouridine2605 synthase
MSARTHLPKTYVVKVTGLLTGEQEQEFRDGIPVMGRRTLPAGLRLIRNAANPWYEIRLTEGRNNQIRVMFKHLGKLVEKLKRVRIGPLELGPLKTGEFRYLSAEEVEKLRHAIRRGSEGKRV